jgi:hypothetical protein
MADKIKKKLNFRCGRCRSKYSKNKIWRKREQDDVNVRVVRWEGQNHAGGTCSTKC